jgi:DNA-binding NtrC family response regulator
MSSRKRVVVVDDDKGMRHILRACLEDEGYEVVTAATGEEALDRLRPGGIDLVITDLVMPGVDGLEILRRASQLEPRPAVVLMTGHASVESAVEALRRGADDYLVKPLHLTEVGARIRRVMARRPYLAPELSPTAASPAQPELAPVLIGVSAAVDDVRRRIARVARTATHVLITGETGTGKELVARSIHAAGPRAAQPFVAVNCGAIPEGLFESTLFGHARGAFTSAMQASAGLIAAADRGTLFLDEVGETPLHLQVKLLRALEDKHITPVGRTSATRVDFRVIASTNRDLRLAAAAGSFRADLFYRLNVVHIAVPPLRSRREDIGMLAHYFMAELNAALGTDFHHLDPAALDALVAYDWPGNVRELRHTVESAMIAGSGATITPADLPLAPPAHDADASLKDATREFERQQVMGMLARTAFDKREAARRLGLSLTSLYRKMDGKPD